MRILIPTEDEHGLEARPHGHFGSAPYFTLVDTTTETVEVVENPSAGHEHGQCRPLQMLRPHRFDAIVCRGMGRRALAALQQQNIDVYVCERASVADVVHAVRSREVDRLTELEACSGGHGHGGPHEHRHRHGCG